MAGGTRAILGRGNTLVEKSKGEQKPCDGVLGPIVWRREGRPTSRDVAIRGIDEPEGPRETKLRRGIRGVRGGENPVYDIGFEATLDDAERIVVFMVHEQDGQVGTNRKTEALDGKGNVTNQRMQPTTK